MYLEKAGGALFAHLIAGPAGDGPVIHFRRGRVVHARAVELLVLPELLLLLLALGLLLLLLGDLGRLGRARGRRVGVARLRHLDQLAGIVEGPVEGLGRRVRLDRADQRDRFLLQRAHHHLGLALLAHRRICRIQRERGVIGGGGFFRVWLVWWFWLFSKRRSLGGRNRRK